ncbi:hypothetical protein ACFQ9X_10365 [Catenulispora yoronensis]
MRSRTGPRAPIATTAVITRRILLTYSIEPNVAAALLPRPFRPDLGLGPALGGSACSGCAESGPPPCRPSCRPAPA